MKARVMRRAGVARGWVAMAVTAVCVFALASSAQLPRLEEAARAADYGLLALALLLGGLTVVLKAARWQALYPEGRRPGLGLAIAATAVGQVANWALPWRVGEVVRVGLASSADRTEPGARRSVTLSAGVIVAEKALDGALLALGALLLIGLGLLPDWLSWTRLLLVAGGALGLASAALLWWSRRPGPGGRASRWEIGRRLPERAAGLARKLEEIGQGAFSWLGTGGVALVLGWSIAAWVVGGLVNYVVLASLGLEPGLGAALAVLVVLYGGAAVPSLPGRVGVFQYLCVLALAPFGVGLEDAFAFSLALYAVVYLPPILLGLLAAALVPTRASWTALTRIDGAARPAAAWDGGPTPSQATAVTGSGRADPGSIRASQLAAGSWIGSGERHTPDRSGRPTLVRRGEVGLADGAHGVSGVESGPVRYSVVVPAYDAARTIGECLEALLDQTVSRDAYEVVVVDDGSTDGTAEVAARYPVRVLRQQHAGPAAARNRGARAAAGEVLLFTDADCAPTRAWIEEIVRPLEADDRVVGVKGAYQTRQTGLVARFSQVELEEKYARLRRQRYIDFVDTYSAAFRREAFWESGGFDPSFAAASNEDTLLSFSLAARGHRLVFAEAAVVYHRHSESLRHYLLRKWRHGYWRVRVYRRHPGKMAGDSYTPRSTQVQLAAAMLAVLTLWLPPLWDAGLAAGLAFVAATLPFVRRALPAGRGVVAAVPGILFLRALALGGGLACGLLALVFVRQRSELR